jgi:hypothetical protein
MGPHFKSTVLFIVVATNTGGTLVVSEVRHAPPSSSGEQKP